MKNFLEYVVSLFGQKRTYQKALLVTLGELREVKRFFEDVKISVLISEDIPPLFPVLRRTTVSGREHQLGPSRPKEIRDCTCSVALHVRFQFPFGSQATGARRQ